MRLLPTLLLACASCTSLDTNLDPVNDLLIVHVANAVPFDRVDYHFANPDVMTLDIIDDQSAPLRSTAQWDEWASAGQGWRDVTAEAHEHGHVIATGSIHVPPYIEYGNGVALADVTMQLSAVASSPPSP